MMNAQSWTGRGTASIRAACLGVAALLSMAGARSSHAQTIYSDDFTSTGTDSKVNHKWYFYDGACLTAGSSTSTTPPNYIPGCSTVWSTYYSHQQTNQSSADAKLVGGANGTSNGGVTTSALDTAGNGALRFTNGYPYGTWEDGSIVSADTFDASQGVQITFKVVTYRGNSGGPGGDGADGLGFLLMDGSLTPGVSPYNGIGAVGGSLGYACSNINPPYDGLIGAYIGLGIDEFGNFLHGAQLYPGYTGSNVVNPSSLGYGDPEGDNAQYGYGFHPNRIGLRGAGNVSWAYLSTKYAKYYPTTKLSTSALQQKAVQNTCISGSVLDYSAGPYSSCPVGSGNYTTSTSPSVSNCPPMVSAATLAAGNYPAFYDYAPIMNGYVELPTTGTNAVKIANESAVARPTGLTTTNAGVTSTSGNVFLYNLKITTDGLLSLSYSLNGSAAQVSVLTNQSISATNGPLPKTLRFGFSAANGGSTNIHELLCFKAAPVTSSATSASTDQQQTGKLETNSQAYFAYYDPNDWTGRMTAYGISFNSAGVVSLSSTATWDSQCVLTGVANISGGTCPTTQASTPSAAQSVTTGNTGSRVMLTWNGVSSGVPFEWPSSTAGITVTEEATLDAGDSLPINANRLNYLRGSRTNEVQSNGSGTFRARDGILGDIVDSSPVWVGPPNSPYSLPFKDRLVSTDATPENTSTNQSYTTFITNNQSRLNVVYTGANDGFLHGFRSGTEDASGNILTTAQGGAPNDGLEVLAYMPGTVLNNVHNAQNSALDLSSPQYGHNFFVDATPGTGDLFYNGVWHTWLVGGLGVGGADIYALDITDPSTTTFNESSASTVVIGDWNASTLSCSGNPSCGGNLGNTYGTPLIRRFHNGMWGVIFGNGFGSSTGDAGIYVMTVNQTTAAKTFYYLSTGTASTSNPNGIAYVTAADLDGDHITDYVYAGDLQGNVWRFDLTSATPGSWAVSTGPLFKTQTGQPITTPVVLASAAVVGTAPALIVSFGTGQRTQLTNTTGTTYSSATQSLYGVWDWNFAAWNTVSSSQYASLSTAQIAAAFSSPALSSPYTFTASNLQQQAFYAGSNTGSVDSTSTTVTWLQCAAASPYTCNGGKLGWYANLAPASATASTGPEQVVSVPSLYQQALLVNSTIPAINNPLSCTTTTDTGNTYIISVTSGGTFTSSASTSKLSGFLTNSDSKTVGENTNETGALTVVRTSNSSYLIGQAIAPTAGTAPGITTAFSLPTNISVNRVTWTQLR